MSSPYDTSTETCPYCNTPGCEADWCDVGVGLIQSGPYVCPNQNCGATSIGPYDENQLTDEERKTGWYKPGKIGTSVNTFQGKPVGHKTAKALYRVGKQLNQNRDQFLRERGWEHSSSHPDSCWRWTKTLNGVTYALNTSDAIEFEERVNHETAWKHSERIDA